MITKQDLEKNYSKFSNSQLLDIVKRKSEYTEIAVEVASDELAKRNIAEEDITKYEKKAAIAHTISIAKNFKDDLTTFQKAMFFIFWFPIFTFAFKNNYKREGYMLKLKQARYFSLAGFISCLAAIIIKQAFNISELVFYIIYAIGLIATLQYDTVVRSKKRLEDLEHELSVNDKA